ncbi:Hypothetical protein HVR_LOCUS786 [uncultured virus]|nr:Hypothetical protein HVR_LOCUS786 [uncultured virus]
MDIVTVDTYQQTQERKPLLVSNTNLQLRKEPSPTILVTSTVPKESSTDIENVAMDRTKFDLKALSGQTPKSTTIDHTGLLGLLEHSETNHITKQTAQPASYLYLVPNSAFDVNQSSTQQQVSKTQGLKILPFSPDMTPESRPGVMVESEPEHVDSENIQKALTLEEQIKSKEFGAILAVCLLGAGIFILSAASNSQIVDIEYIYGNGLSIGWFLVINIILAVATAHMVYRPYILDRANGKNIILWALILYVVAQIAWAVALFHSRINRGTAGVAIILFLAATVWLGWTCYHLDKGTIYIFLVLLFWCFYLQTYTSNVDAHPWIPVGAE